MPDDIEKIRRAEERRGRRPKDEETTEARQRLKAVLREIWKYGTVDDFEEVMRELGVSPDSPQWRDALKIWRAGREPD